MTFKDAKKQCRKVGTAHAEGDALRAMYAEMLAFKWYAIGNAERFYQVLGGVADSGISDRARELLRDHNAALDAVLA